MAFTTPNLSPILAVIAGILILIFPEFLRYVVGLYLVLTGLMGLRNKNFSPQSRVREIRGKTPLISFCRETSPEEAMQLVRLGGCVAGRRRIYN